MGFSFPRTALGLTVFLSLSLGWISFQYYRQQTELVRLFEKEAIGVEAAKDLTVELLTFSTSPTVSKERALNALALLQKKEVQSLIGRADLKNDIHALAKSFAEKRSTPLSDSEVHQVADLLKSSLRSVIEQTDLLLDPSLHTYYFVEALFSQFPDVIYQEYSWQELLTFRENKNREALFAEIGARRAAFKNYQDSLRRAITENKEPLADENALLPVQGLTAQTLQLFQTITSPRKINEDFFNTQLAQWREESEKALKRESQIFAELNQKRLTSTAKSLTISLIVFFASWIISLAFLTFIVRSFWASRNVLHRVIRAQRDALSKASRLATLGEMSASIGHEITNPLAVIRATTDLLEKNFGEAQPGIYKHSERIRRMALRIEDIIRSMKTFLNVEKDEPADAEPVDIIKILEDLREDCQPRLQSTHTHLTIENADAKSILVMGNYSEFLQVFTNLVSNAIDAVKDQAEKEIVIRIHNSDAFTEVEVQDSGPGVPKELKKHIFEALFTTKSTGEGTGLGLSIAQRIVSRYQGRLRLTDKGPGACFEVVLNRYVAT